MNIHVVLHGEETGGEVSMMDNGVPEGAKGPYLHTHDFDEAFYLLEGELTFQLGDDLVEVRPGEVAFAREAGVEPPAWALQPIPEVTRVGPRIGEAE